MSPITGKRIFTVAEITRNIKGLLEGELSGVWLEGEISNFKTYGSGHSYFTLKDEKAQISGVIWKGSKKYLKFSPSDGDMVLCRGRVSVYEPRGNYQFVVESMEPKGLGALQAAYEELKNRLDKEGLFAPEKKKKLPTIAWRVGIVTSPSGAVIRDMIRTISRRFPGIQILFAPAAVQGEGAAQKIAHAIDDLNEHNRVDLIIVGRGGGSLEDLWAFNEEAVARAIAASTIPIISAVGHETDFTIADFVADKRASTPTAAAEIVAPERRHVEEEVDNFTTRLDTTLRNQLETNAQTLDAWTNDMDKGVGRKIERLHDKTAGVAKHLRAVSPRNRLMRNKEKLTTTERAMTNALLRIQREKKNMQRHQLARFASFRPTSFLTERSGALTQQETRLATTLHNIMALNEKRLALATSKLTAYSPQAVLDRGYSIVRSSDGKAIYRDAAETVPGQKVVIQFAKGERAATIDGDEKRQESLF